jgi:hypothetical protein
MRQEPTTRPPQTHSRRPRPGRIGSAVAGLVGVAFLAGACAVGSPNASQTTTTAGSAANGSTSTARAGAGTPNTGAGVVTRSVSATASSTSGDESAGSYSVDFARCMRAHGVPKFPDPDGSAGQLGPDSGIDPTSPVFQSALNGPCQSLAPAGWVSSGPVSK